MLIVSAATVVTACACKVTGSICDRRSTQRGCNVVDQVAIGINLETIEFTRGAEIKPQADIRFTRKITQIDAGLTPLRCVVQFLNNLRMELPNRRRGRKRIGQFGIG